MSKLYVSASTDAIRTQRTARAHHQAAAHVRGWDSGVEIIALSPVNSDTITYEIYRTSGSNNTNGRALIGKLKFDMIGDLISTEGFHCDPH